MNLLANSFGKGRAGSNGRTSDIISGIQETQRREEEAMEDMVCLT